MQPETHFAASFSEQPIGISQEGRLPQAGKTTHPKSKLHALESKIDIVTTAIVIGGTAQFISFIFGLVTEIWPRVVHNILMSAAIGLCFGAIAYVLMRKVD